MQKRLMPVAGSWVKYRDATGTEKKGIVRGHLEGSNPALVRIDLLAESKSVKIPLVELGSGFQQGMDVQDVPISRVKESYGEGRVVTTRRIGGRDQVLVDFPSLGKQVWLPFEHLRQTKGVKHRFFVGDKGPDDSGERFRLKTLAHAIELWNENTGSLSSLDIDPLPHQIHLVHHILASGNLNWLIADDVGLGKTIETGMLLAALKQRGILKRVLLITPAGLTRQWQEELCHKFSFEQFRIYGEDFLINDPQHWKMYDHVIGSIDRLKDKKHLERLLLTDPWDLIIFDEGHRLTRRQYGLKFEASQRFMLAAKLRKRTDSMIILSATPHQGMHDKFTALLELLRPERKDEISRISMDPGILREMVFRNHKADVTDSDGNFIFKGKTTKALIADQGVAAATFDRQLQNYFRKGYAAGKALGVHGNAIGFVMTVYRKLASSSIMAIHSALIRRRDTLRGLITLEKSSTRSLEMDERYAGETEEETQTSAVAFFEGEVELLDAILLEAERIIADDRKLRLFIDSILHEIKVDRDDQKVLIFTEYRRTQEYLAGVLRTRFGQESVEIINGSMGHEERRNAIRRFEDGAHFLVSTEAGGEGINLQRSCHIMVNYDLPWNPMRLVQRIGRLYRYGQKKKVLVFNMYSPGTMDEKIIGLMYDRIQQVVSDLSTIGNEFNENLYDDILGDVADIVDVKGVLAEAMDEGIERTKERIGEAAERAREAASKQMELFQNAARYDASEIRNELSMGLEHVRTFVDGMFRELGVEVTENTHSGSILHIKLPDLLKQELGLSKSRLEVTLDRDMASHRPHTHMLDLGSPIFRHLLFTAKSYEFKGQTAVVRSEVLGAKAMLSSILRWQNDQGNRMRQELAVFVVHDDDRVELNPQEVSDWLKDVTVTGQHVHDREDTRRTFSLVENAADFRLSEISNAFLHPENCQWVASSWVERSIE